jgi:hypothetical protein
VSGQIDLVPSPEDFDEVQRIAEANALPLRQAAAKLLRLGIEANRVDSGRGIAQTPSPYALDCVHALGDQQRLVRLAKHTALAMLDAIQPMLDALADADPQAAGLVANAQGRALRQYARDLADEYDFALPSDSSELC